MIKNIVLDGGGIKAIGYIGVAQALQEYDIYDKLHTYVGSSAGSIVATLMAINFSPEELETILTEVDFNKFKDNGGYFGIFTDIHNLYKNYGIYMNEYLYEWIGTLIEEKTGNKDISFKELNDMTNKELIIITTNYTKMDVNFFSSIHTPDISVRFAIKASTSIPVFYQPVNYNNDQLIDGGLLLNYAISYFNFNDLDETIGFRFSNDGLSDNNNSPKNVTEYLYGIITLVLHYISKKNIIKEDWKHTVTIPTNINAIDFDISMKQKDKLINDAYTFTVDYLNKLFE
jgi:NTE family protein